MTRWNFEPGQILLLQLTNGTFCGEFVSAVENSRINLTNVCRQNDKSAIPGRRTYYKHEIVSVRTFCDTSSASEVSVSSKEQVGLALPEYQAIERLIQNYTYIQQVDETYHRAVKELAAEDYIAIGLEGNGNKGRISRTWLLSVATSKNVYLFDILFLGRVQPELKCVLEARFPRKIVHDGRLLLDNLRHTQKVEMRPIFDTMVAHIATSRQKRFVSVEECLNRHFNLELSEESLEDMSRPLTDTHKLVAAKRVAYLIKLHRLLVAKAIACEHKNIHFFA